MVAHEGSERYILWVMSKDTLEAALHEAGWSVRAAAKALGVSRPTVYAYMARHGVKRQPRTADALSRSARRANEVRWGRKREGVGA